ncbi:hypothetical protein [Methanolobus sp. WCC4]|uniref:hypothetical protein n=1 Tax=Methanolobus sp. WCC4 TaxID=3125784 RepID=UPI0030F89196
MAVLTENPKGKSYKCHNCGYFREVVIPCNSCGDQNICCPFCGEQMTRLWESYNE